MNARFFHIRRAGGHAVIDWFFRSVHGPYWFHNSLPLRARQPRSFWLRGNSLTEDPQHVFWSIEDPNRGRRSPADATPFATCIENHFITWLPAPDHTIVIMRDFANNMASRMKAEEKPGAKKRFWRDGDHLVWLDMARWCVNNLDRTILFNRWMVDEPYRQEVAARYGLTAAPYESATQKYGGGSSFSGSVTPADPRALNNRYLSYTEQITPLLTDEIIHLNRTLFNMELTR